MGNATVEKYLPLGLDIAIARESWAAEEDYTRLSTSDTPLDEPGSPDGPLPWEEE